MEDEVAVVTGGSSGIGFATAMRFVAEGARVIITGRRRLSPRGPSPTSATTALFRASVESSFVTGVDFYVAGGMAAS